MHVANLGLTRTYAPHEPVGGLVVENVFAALPIPFSEEIGKAYHWIMDIGNTYMGPHGYVPEGAEALVGINPCFPPADVKGEPPYSAEQRSRWKQQCAVQKAQAQAIAAARTQEVVQQMEYVPWYKQSKYYWYAAGALLVGAVVVRAIRR